MMTAWDLATEAWLDKAEATSRLHSTELAEFKQDNPMPNVGEFMKGTF